MQTTNIADPYVFWPLVRGRVVSISSRRIPTGQKTPEVFQIGHHELYELNKILPKFELYDTMSLLAT